MQGWRVQNRKIASNYTKSIMFLFMMIFFLLLCLPAWSSPYIYGIHSWSKNAKTTLSIGDKKVWAVELYSVDSNWPLDVTRFEEMKSEGFVPLLHVVKNFSNATIPLSGDCNDYGNTLVTLLTPAKDLIHHIVIGNEMNSTNAANGSGIEAGQYINCFKNIRTKIKTAFPDMQVIIGPVALWNPATNCSEGPYTLNNTFDYVYRNYLFCLAKKAGNDTDGFAMKTVGGKNSDSDPKDDDFYGFQAFSVQSDIIKDALPSVSIHKPLYILEFHHGGDGVATISGTNEKGPVFLYPSAFLLNAYEAINSYNNDSKNISEIIGNRIKMAAWWVYDLQGWNGFAMYNDIQKQNDFKSALANNYMNSCKGSNSRNSEITSFVVPKTMLAGSVEHVEITMRNIASEVWSRNERIRFGTAAPLAEHKNQFLWKNVDSDQSGNFSDCYSNGIEDQRVCLRSNNSVSCGDSVTFYFSLQAPDTKGNYYFSGQMVKDGTGWFGDVFETFITIEETETSIESLTAQFDVEPQSGTPPLSVNFSENSLGNPDAFVWDFGDGSQFFEQNPSSHVYENIGEYTVTLSVFRNDGNESDSMSKTITVAVQKEIPVDFEIKPNSGMAPLTVRFINKSDESITHWLYQFGNIENSISTESNTQFTYDNPGEYKVTLRAYNDNGEGGIKQKTVSVFSDDTKRRSEFPDFVVEQLQLNRLLVLVGEQVEAMAFVKNDGSALQDEVFLVDVDFFLNDTFLGTVAVDSAKFTPSETVIIPYAFLAQNAVHGENTLKVIVDKKGNIYEQNKVNNEKSLFFLAAKTSTAAQEHGDSDGCSCRQTDSDNYSDSIIGIFFFVLILILIRSYRENYTS